MTAAKQQLRLWIRNIRDSIPDDVARIAADAAAQRLLAHPLIDSVSVVAVYAPISSELDPTPLANALRQRGATLAYPRVSRSADRLVFHRVDSPTELSPGTLGILEPADDAPVVAPELIDLFIVPGLAFDRAGGRLGWGKGYYDLALSDSPRATRVGFGFECQIVDEVPRREWDAPMTHVVTEAGLRICRSHLPGA